MDAYEVYKRIGETLQLDRAEGRLKPLSHYQQQFPGHDDLIAREFAAHTRDQTASAPPMGVDWLTSQHRHRYETLSELARGGMGSILHIRDEMLQRDLAMKVVLGPEGQVDGSSPATEDPLARRFVEEARITAQLDHPGVVPVHELGVDYRGQPFFTMKLVKGRTLAEVFERARSGDPTWSRNRVLEVFIRVLETLAYAHEKGVIHRDLKPANVMVGDFGEVYVMDWGLAKSLGASGDEESSRPVQPPRDSGGTLTEAGEVLGTPAYMPLEQAKGRPIDGRADIYAVGGMLYEFLAGCHPYATPDTSPSNKEVLLQLFEHPPAPVEELAEDVPADLAAIVAKAISREQKDRYATAQAFAADLWNFIEGRVVAAHESGTWAELRKWIRRNHALAGSILAAILLLVAGLVTATTLGLRAAQEGDAARRNAYRAQIGAAVAELENRDSQAVRIRLEATPPELRGWEWRYLESRLDESLMALEGIGLARAPDGAGFLVLEQSGRVTRWDPQRRTSQPVRGAGAPSSRSWLAPGGTHRLIATADPVVQDRWTLQVEPLFGEGIARTVSFLARQFMMEGTTDNIGPSGWARSTRMPYFVYSAGDAQLAVLDLDTEETRVLELPGKGRVVGNSEHPPYLFIASEQAAHQAVIDARTLAPVFAGERTRDRTVLSAVWTADGERIATGLADYAIELIDAGTGAPTAWRRAKGHTGNVLALAVSPDGSLLASGGMDRVILLHDGETGQLRRTFHGHARQITELLFSTDGDYLLSLGMDDKVRVWSARGHDPTVLRGHASYVYDVSFSPDGSRLYSGGWDGYVGSTGPIRVWDTDTGAAIAAFGGKDRCALSVELSSDGRTLVTAGSDSEDNWMGGAVCVWNTDTGRLVRRLPGRWRRATLSPDGRQVAASTVMGHVDVLDLETGQTRAIVADVDRQGLGFTEVAPAFSPDGLLLAAVARDIGSFSLFDASTLEEVRHVPGRSGRLFALAFHPDGTRIATASTDQTVRVWSVATGDEVGVQAGHGDEVLAATYDPSGRRLLSGARDLSVRIWDADSLEEIVRLPEHEAYVIAVAVSPDEQTIASASGDKTVRLWDTRPVSEWHRARAERRLLVDELRPVVKRLFEETGDADEVVRRLRSNPGLTGRRREVALQIALGMSVERGNPR